MAWHELRMIDDEFFRSAPVTSTVTVNLKVTPEQLSAAFAGDGIYRAWGRLVTDAAWQSDPAKVDAIRTVTLARYLSIRERYYRWDVNERMTFGAEAATLPGVRAFGEDYVILPAPSGSRLQWTVAADLGALPAPFARALSTAMRAVTRWLGGLLARNLRE